MRFALATLYAMIGLTIARYYPIERDKILATMFAILSITHTHRQRTLVLALVVVYKDGWDIHTVRTRHAVLTIVARNVFETYNLLGDILIEESHLLLGKWLQRTVREQVILQVLHIGHTTQYGKYALVGACIAESP
jgi:hypothetical protein